MNLAYQVFGEGPLTLVVCLGFISHLDLQWADPGATRFYTRLASFCRVVLFDKAGTGLSDPVTRFASLEERADDVRVIVDAVGAERVALLGESEGGPSAMLFAASHPQRVEKLVLYGSIAKSTVTDAKTEPWGFSTELQERFERVVANWGQGKSIELFAPSLDSPVSRIGWGTFERASVSPSMARALLDAVYAIDVTEIAAVISAPTLVIHRRGDRAVPVDAGRYLAAHIGGAQMVELEGEDHAYQSGDFEPILDAIERFLTGSTTHQAPTRVLATVLFTDIVDSTRRAAEAGDAAWRELLGKHDALVARHVHEADGRVVKSLGDGALAVLPGPARAITCAQGILKGTESLGLSLRAGVHTGECETVGDDLAGLAVHIGARVAALAAPGEVMVSSTVKDLVVGSPLAFADRGEHTLKGVPGMWRLYAVVGAGRTPVLGPVAPNMKRRDRATVTLARHAPGVMRAVTRLTSSG